MHIVSSVVDEPLFVNGMCMRCARRARIDKGITLRSETASRSEGNSCAIGVDPVVITTCRSSRACQNQIYTGAANRNPCIVGSCLRGIGRLRDLHSRRATTA